MVLKKQQLKEGLNISFNLNNYFKQSKMDCGILKVAKDMNQLCPKNSNP